MSIPGGTRVHVVHGTPDRLELAALVAALTRGEQPATETETGRERREPPAWLRAAWREASGARPVAAPWELRRP